MVSQTCILFGILEMILSDVESDNEEADVANENETSQQQVIKTYGKKKHAPKKKKNK